MKSNQVKVSTQLQDDHKIFNRDKITCPISGAYEFEIFIPNNLRFSITHLNHITGKVEQIPPLMITSTGDGHWHRFCPIDMNANDTLTFPISIKNYKFTFQGLDDKMVLLEHDTILKRR